MTLTLNTGTRSTVHVPIPEYGFDKKTGEVTMPSGKKFNPILNQNCDELSLEELRIYNLERGLTDSQRRLPEHHSPEYVWGTPSDDAELERLAEEALEADIAAKDAVAKQTSTKAALKKALEEAGKLDSDTKAVGVVRTIIKRVRRFDAKLAEELLTPEEVAKYSAISSALVKANVAPTVYEMMQADQGFSLELKVDAGK